MYILSQDNSYLIKKKIPEKRKNCNHKKIINYAEFRLFQHHALYTCLTFMTLAPLACIQHSIEMQKCALAGLPCSRPLSSTMHRGWIGFLFTGTPFFKQTNLDLQQGCSWICRSFCFKTPYCTDTDN